MISITYVSSGGSPSHVIAKQIVLKIMHASITLPKASVMAIFLHTSRILLPEGVKVFYGRAI